MKPKTPKRQMKKKPREGFKPSYLRSPAEIKGSLGALNMGTERFELMVDKPPMIMGWTMDVPGYVEAMVSAAFALRDLYLATENARHLMCSPIDRFLWEMGAGLRQWKDPELPYYIAEAQKLNRPDIIKELGVKMQNATKRKTVEYGGYDLSRKGFSDLNAFRWLLAKNWTSKMLWLMSDDMIARVVTTIKLKPDGCNRQTISEAVRQMGLVKCPGKPLVKGIGEKGVFIFAEGYPPHC